MYSLYVPAVYGAIMEVASPAALVMVAPSTKVVVPGGANHTVFEGSPLLLIFIWTQLPQHSLPGIHNRR